MNHNVINQSTFDRTLYNEKKLGAYFTNQKDAMLLRNLFKFPADESCCCIDPSCGDGVALSIVTGRDFGSLKVVNFGVELDRDRYNEAKSNESMDYVIMADFMAETTISRECFSFGYLNPPYGVSMVGDRYEKIFFKRLDNYLKPGAILCMVVPYYIFIEDEGLCKIITNRYDILSCFKFREFEQFKQVALICRKKSQNVPNTGMCSKFREYITNIDNVFVLPDEVPENAKYNVPPSSPEDVKVFQGDRVDMDIIKTIPSQSSLFKFFFDNTRIREAYGEMDRPPVMPSKSHIYLLATCGYGKGIVGEEERGDRHLQRGRVLEGEEKTQQVDPVTGEGILTVRSFKKTIITILQNDGTLTKLGS